MFRSTVVAFSQQPSVAEFMKRFLDGAGYDAIACWSGVDDLERIVDEIDPLAVVYDVGLPFAPELNRLHEIRRRPSLADKPFVIATAAPQALCRRCGVKAALDIFTRPTARDVDAALHSAVAACPERSRRAPLATDAA